jgi:enoyl-CoA hydratase/carnithine racemase
VIRFEDRPDGIALITIDRPAARNAMTLAMWDTLRDAALALDRRDDVRAVVITGAGGRAFVSGTDIAEFSGFAGPEDGIAYEARIEAVIAALEALRVPAIAAISGACTGGGVSIAAACDVRIGGPGTRVGVPIARTLGNCISLRNLARLAAVIGLDAAKALLLTARLADGVEAHRLGFLHELAPDDDGVLPQALRVAGEIAQLAPLTLRVTKDMARRIRAATPLPDAGDLLRLCYGSDDFHAGVAAFLAKSSARWSGR